MSFRQRPKSLRPASESRPSARARNERSCRARSGGGRDQLLVVVGGSTRARRDSRQREAPQAPTACRRRLPARRTSRDISHPGEATSGRQNSPNRTSFPTPNQRCRAVRPGGVDRVSRASRGSRTSARPRVTQRTILLEILHVEADDDERAIVCVADRPAHPRTPGFVPTPCSAGSRSSSSRCRDPTPRSPRGHV